MLVLTRKRDEAIILDGDIRVRVLSIGHTTVRLGIEAPSGIGIVREELVLDAEERAGRREWELAATEDGAQNA